MDREELKNEYFDWLYGLVYPWDKDVSEEYRNTRLLRFLFETPFYSVIENDSNRISDGICLRYEFGYQKGYDDRTVLIYLDDRECSVLELMIGLAIKCEKQIMYDVAYGDRTAQWFRKMISSLGLNGMNNRQFDEMYVNEVVDKFLNREYEADGRGSLFAISNPSRDMRTVEIWSQLCEYLNEYTNTERYRDI